MAMSRVPIAVIDFGRGILFLMKVTQHLFYRHSVFKCLPVEVTENLTEFGAALTRAVVTDSTLELADGTSFLGEAILGSKVFIRPCYPVL